MLSAGVYQLSALNTDSIFTELNQLDCKKSHWQVPEMMLIKQTKSKQILLLKQKPFCGLSKWSDQPKMLGPNSQPGSCSKLLHFLLTHHTQFIGQVLFICDLRLSLLLLPILFCRSWFCIILFAEYWLHFPAQFILVLIALSVQLAFQTALPCHFTDSNFQAGLSCATSQLSLA